MSPRLSSVDAEGTEQKVQSKENEIKQGGNVGADTVTVARTAGAGAAIGGLADRSWEGAGIGAGNGSGVGLAKGLPPRGKEGGVGRGRAIGVGVHARGNGGW